MEEDKKPVVFISYSHDSPNHKMWVANLATMLVNNGVDTIFDQWDLRLGDDLPKFMEKSVSTAERVLVVCTEAYVRKADDGKGGVGYEAMIVTGELVKDLGTSKFIPIIRQDRNQSQALLPSCLCTRNYIDFSDDSSFDDNFSILLRELHDAPIVEKPALGENPFARSTNSVLTLDITEEQIVERINSLTSFKDVQHLYEKCLSIIMSNDTLAWRKLVQGTRIDFSKELN